MTAVSGDIAQARILVLEDNYYLAMDLRAALEAAGAIVIGPFSDAGEACRALAVEQPDCALVDLNLGRGISFELPRELTRLGIPFAFVTGYDDSAIPEDFAATIRIEKPFPARRVAEIAGGLVARRR